MRKRDILMIIFLIIPVIIQLFGIPYLWLINTPHDVQFTYEYNWHLDGYGGWYEGYTEHLHAQGNYIIDYIGNTGQVTAQVTWTFESRLFGSLETSYGDTDYHTFTYSLLTGQYISGTDQDFDTTGMNVWFHVPGGFQASSYSILDANYGYQGNGIIWVGQVMPFNGKHLLSYGEYFRDDDVYGQFDATYRSEYYFTDGGLIIGEIYTEDDQGYDYETGYWSQFRLYSSLFVTASNYYRPFAFGVYFMAYWFHLIFFAIIFYVIYEHFRWRAIRVPPSKKEKEVIIERKLPREISLSITSPYSEIIPSYIMRAKSQGKKIVSAHNREQLRGIGFIDEKERIGSFFGFFNREMIKYTKVKYAFTEDMHVTGFRTIEVYDVFKIEDLQTREFNYDVRIIRSATQNDLKPIMSLISNEDSGTRDRKHAKWVLKSFETDVIMVATASVNEEWIREIISDITRYRYPKPDVYDGKVLLGVGITTPGEKEGWLYGLYVHPAFRNLGVGTSLVKARLSSLKELGCESAITEIAEWNGPAKNIYDDFFPRTLGKIHFLGKKVPKIKVRRH